MNILFLDDDKKRQQRFLEFCPQAIVVSTAADCIEQLKKQAWDVVHLDHDLEGTFCDPAGKNTGSEVVRYVWFNKPSVGRFVVHTHNYIIYKAMIRLLRKAGYTARYKPFNFDYQESYEV